MNEFHAALFAGIAPPPPRTLRASRYQGEDHAIPLAAMTADDATTVRNLYASVFALRDALQRGDGDVPFARRAFEADAIERARWLGRGARYEDEQTRQAVHDVRGGALTSLSLLLHQHWKKPGTVSVQSLATLAVDQLKIMRNAVADLDPGQRRADMASKPHSIERLVATLEGIAGETVGVDLYSSFHGVISMSCMEIGTLDRAVLNVANNALEHALRGPVRIWLSPASPAAKPDLRVVVANSVDGGHAAALTTRFGADLSRLFVERFTTTGSGEGMRVCAQLVAGAYGVRDAEAAVATGLVGARIVGTEFVAWLHWPAVE